MADSVYCLINSLFFDISLLCYRINLRLSIIFCFSFGDIYLSLGIYLSCPFVTVSELFCYGLFEIPIILLAILLPIKSPLASAFFFNCSFWSSFTRICCRFFSMIKKFLTVFTTQGFTYIFTNILTIFLAKDKNL